MGGSTSEGSRSGAHGRLAPLTLSLPVDPRALSGARKALDEWLAAGGVIRRDVEDVLIAANEAWMNAVEHSGTSPADGIRVSARAIGGRLWLETRDSGTWREPTPRTDRGHGMNLMRELTDAVVVDHEADGTKVVMEKALRFGEAPPRGPAAAAGAETGWIGEVCVARLSGEIDLAAVKDVEAEVDAATADRREGLVVDLSAASYLDSAGVHMLYRLAHRRRTAGASTAVVAPAGPVRRVLELTHMEAAMPVEDNLESATRALGNRTT